MSGMGADRRRHTERDTGYVDWDCKGRRMIYPVAEIFQSIQGEGRWQGTPMTFIRLAGCTVGKPYSAEARKTLGLPIYVEKCCDVFGTGFPCDTDYRVKQRLTEGDIVRTKEVAGA